MTNIPIKTAEEVEKMRIVGKMAASVLEMIEPHVVPGVSTNQLNDICHKYINDNLNAIPAPLNYRGFPKSICTSINNVVCHGIPSAQTLKNGDIINIDITVKFDGYHGDTSKMFLVGDKVSIKAKRLCDIARECMVVGIKMVKPGRYLGDIGYAIEKHAQKHYYSSVHDFCGHGIGKNFHEPPEVLNFGKRNTGEQLQENMIITIEPMINAGKKDIKILADDWTAVTKDRTLSAQWEHTILVTKSGFEVLTRRHNEEI